MNFSLKKIIFLVVVAICACSNIKAQLVGPNAFLKNRWLEAGQAMNGSFGPGPAPSGYHPGIGTNLAIVYDYGHDGWTTGSPAYFGDYTYPGVPYEGWSIEVNGARSDAFYTNGSGTSFWNGNPALSSLSGNNVGCLGTAQAWWQGTAGPGTPSGTLSISQTTTVSPGANWIVVNTFFQNTGSTTLTKLYYLRSCDPDNDFQVYHHFETYNSIVFQNDAAHRVLVNSTGTGYSNAYLALGTKDDRAKAFIYRSWSLAASTALTLEDIYNQTTPPAFGSMWYAAGTTINNDYAIGLIYNLGDLEPGQSTCITYAYILDGDASIDAISFPTTSSTSSASAGTIIGPDPICAGNSYTYTNPTASSGGAWSCSPGATINPSTGVLTAGTVGGTVTITYAINSGYCNTTFTTKTVTVIAAPVFSVTPNYTYPNFICPGTVYTLSVTPNNPGDTYLWSNGVTTYSMTSTAPSPGGISLVFNVTVTNPAGCSTTQYVGVDVDPEPEAGEVQCPPNFCAADPTWYMCTVTGNIGTGTWSLTGGGTDVSIDAFGGLIVNPAMMVPHTCTASYTVSNSCGSDVASCTFTVYPNPQFTMTPAYPFTSCSGVPFTLGVVFTPPYSAPGHTYSWNTGATTQSSVIAPTTPDGISLIYDVTVTNSWGCSAEGHTGVDLNPSPVPVMETFPSTALCAGESSLIWAYTTGGTTYTSSWSCTPPSGTVVTLSSPTLNSVVVTGVSGGTATVTYTVTNTAFPNCSAYVTRVVTVNPSPAPITGPTTACVGNTTTLGETVPGGVWTSSNIFVATIAASGTDGIVTGVAPGTVTITYSIGSCHVTYAMTVIPSPTPILKKCASDICEGNSKAVLGDPTYLTGYIVSWSCSPPSGTVITLSSPSAAGVTVTGTAAGGATLTYTVTDPNTGCSGYAYCNINVWPAPAPLTGPADICEGQTGTFSGPPAGGTWISSNPAVASVDAMGNVTGLSGGTTIIDYILPPPMSDCYSSAVVNIIGRATACVFWGHDPACTCNAFIFSGTAGANVNYEVYDCDGNLIFTGSLVLDPSGNGVVHAADLPQDACRLCIKNIEYMGCKWRCRCTAGAASGDCCAYIGAPKAAHTTISGNAGTQGTASHLDVIPNPNKGIFTLKGDVQTNRTIQLEVYDVLGQLVYSAAVNATEGNINHVIRLGDSMANGIYLIKVTNDEVNELLRFTLQR